MKPDAIWIDLDNSPHVPLFAPIIRHYREQGIEVILTARDHAQTVQLLDLHGFSDAYRTIGKHYGGGKLNKIAGLFIRAIQLAAYVRGTHRRISVALSHGSRSMVLAARLLGIPVITMYDYEHTETGIFNRLSTRVLVPEQIPDAVLQKGGLPVERRIKYPGIKEELYVRDFVYDEKFRDDMLARLGIHDDRTLVVLRPPATTANYYSPRGNEMFEAVLQRLIASDGVLAIIVPRDREQGKLIDRKIGAGQTPGRGRCVVLTEAVDGLQLAAAADLLISGGGTMNREAMLLGVPVYSIFTGKTGALDEEMERSGQITYIRSIDDIDAIKLDRLPPYKDRGPRAAITDRVERSVIEQINSFLNIP